MGYPFVQASSYTKGRTSKVLFVVIHDMEMAEKPTTAEACAAYFARSTTQASSHYCIDNDSVVQCVRESDTAWCAPGANSTGIHLEHAGFASQSRVDWLDPFGKAMLARSAKLTAEICQRYSIPIRKGDYNDIRAGRPSIVGHWDVTKAYPDKGSHTDPGANFPWDYYIQLVKAAATGGAAAPQEDEVTPQDIKDIAAAILSAKVVDASKIPFGGKLDPDLKITLPEAAAYAMRWSLEGRDAGTLAARLAEAQAAKGSALTADEVKAAFKAALSESVQLDLSVKPAAVTE